MAARTLEEIENFVSGTVVTEIYVAETDYPYYYLGESFLGWAEYLDTNAFDPFEVLGLTVKVIRVETEDYDEELNESIIEMITAQGVGLTDALAKIASLSGVSIERRS